MNKDARAALGVAALGIAALVAYGSRGQTLYMHCYASHGRGAAMFHHAVRIYYW